MIIDWSSGEERRSAKVFDANGEEYHSILWCDTESGELYRHTLNDGKPIMDKYGDLLTELITVPAPLRVEFYS